MKRLAIWIFFTGILLLQNAVTAQNRPSLSIKCASPGLFNLKYKLALEWRQRDNLIFELTGNYQLHNMLEENAFIGVITKDYTLQRRYYFRLNNPEKLEDSGWLYLGDGKMIQNPAAAGEINISTFRLNLGVRFAQEWGSQRLKYFIQPAITLAVHKTYFVGPVVQQTGETTYSSWQIGSGDLYQAVQTADFSQSQQKNFKQYWISGPACQFGLTWVVVEGFSFEPRFNIALNIGSKHLPNSTIINELRQLYGHLDFMFCYTIGM